MVGRKQSKGKYNKNYPKTWSIAAQAGNADASKSPKDANHKIKFIYGEIIVATDATAVNRYLTLIIKDASNNVIAHLCYTVAQGASATKTYNFVGGYFSEQGDFVYYSSGILIYQPLIIYGTDKLVVSLVSGVAGDESKITMKYLEVPIDEEFPE